MRSLRELLEAGGARRSVGLPGAPKNPLLGANKGSASDCEVAAVLREQAAGTFKRDTSNDHHLKKRK